MHRLLAFTIASTGLLATTNAAAFALTPTGSGATAHWEPAPISVVVDPSIDALGAGAHEAVDAAFAAWKDIDGIGIPDVTVTSGAADAIGYRPNVANTNTVRFVPGGYPPAGGALSITIATFDASGAILDADVIVNGLPGFTFAVLDPAAPLTGAALVGAPYDLQNVLTHEAGHFFGLAHANDQPDDTMFPTSARGETKKRDLSADDVAGARSIYPDQISARSCSASGAGTPGLGWIALAGMALGGLALSRRRRSAALAGAAALAAFVTAAVPRAHAEQSTPASAARRESSTAVVEATESWWEDGVIVTGVDLVVNECPQSAQCPPARHRVEVFGGTVADLTQIVSGLPVPAAGQSVALTKRADGYGWPDHLAPARSSRVASLLVGPASSR